MMAINPASNMNDLQPQRDLHSELTKDNLIACSPEDWFLRYTASSHQAAFSDDNVDTILADLVKREIYRQGKDNFWTTLHKNQQNTQMSEEATYQALEEIADAISYSADFIHPKISANRNTFKTVGSTILLDLVPDPACRPDGRWTPPTLDVTYEPNSNKKHEARAEKEIIDSISFEEYKKENTNDDRRDVSA
jgi:hypothetical protein